MKSLRSLITMVAIGASTLVMHADFRDHLGLQLWSLRANTLTHGAVSTLDLAKSLGFTELEGSLVTANLTPAQVRAAIDVRGLSMPSAHAQYGDLNKDLAGQVRAAQTLGVEYVICPWIPHQGTFDRTTMEQAIVDFNRAGAAFRAAGIKFGYHPHGYEFVPSGHNGETLLDELIRGCRPEDVCFELDVFWAVHGGADPIKLLQKYAGRWMGIHVKDIRKGAPTGLTTGQAPETDKVATGDGAIDWKPLLTTAQKVGIKYYFIEDETPAPLTNIPLSLAYLKALKL